MILRDVFVGWGKDNAEGTVDSTVLEERQMEDLLGFIGVTGSECALYHARTVRSCQRSDQHLRSRHI